MNKIFLITALLMLGGCVSHWDLQGEDPKEYYSKHPIQNKIETRNRSATTQFLPRATRLTAEEVDDLRTALRGVSPAAAEAVEIWLADADIQNDARRTHLGKMLRNMGYSTKKITFRPSAELARNDVRIDVRYAAVVAPKCPDWRRSPVTSYSNTGQGNFRCAQEVNLGLMVADPHDLVRGSGESEMDTTRAAKAIETYRGGSAAPASGSASSAAADTAAAAGASAGSPPQ